MFGKIHVLPILRSVAYSFPILILQISHPLFSPSRIAEPFSSEVLSQKGNLNSHMYLNLLCKKAFITLNTLATFTFFFSFQIWTIFHHECKKRRHVTCGTSDCWFIIYLLRMWLERKWFECYRCNATIITQLIDKEHLPVYVGFVANAVGDQIFLW